VNNNVYADFDLSMLGQFTVQQKCQRPVKKCPCYAHWFGTTQVHFH